MLTITHNSYLKAVPCSIFLPLQGLRSYRAAFWLLRPLRWPPAVAVTAKAMATSRCRRPWPPQVTSNRLRCSTPSPRPRSPRRSPRMPPRCRASCRAIPSRPTGWSTSPPMPRDARCVPRAWSACRSRPQVRAARFWATSTAPSSPAPRPRATTPWAPRSRWWWPRWATSSWRRTTWATVFPRACPIPTCWRLLRRRPRWICW